MSYNYSYTNTLIIIMIVKFKERKLVKMKSESLINEQTQSFCIGYINKNFSEIGNIQPNEFNTKTKQIHVIIQAIKAYINRATTSQMQINSNITAKFIQAIASPGLHIAEKSQRDSKIGLLQILLAINGFSCGVNECYDDITKSKFKEFRKSRRLESYMNKYIYDVGFKAWKALLNIKDTEDK